MILHMVRVFFILAVLSITATFAFQPNVFERGQEYVTFYILLPAVIAFGVVALDILWQRKRLDVLSGLFFGLLAGLTIAYVLAKIVELIQGVFPQVANDPVIELVKVLLGASAVFLCVTIVLQTKDEFRFVVPYVEFAKQTKGARSLLLDTSVIIDGRIADICDTRVMEGELIVPRFILTELQAIADSEDKLRRNRGRRGLDILNRLQNSEKVDIRILDTHVSEVDDADEVDAKLVALAKHLGARVVTNDYNLNKISQLRGVEVININDLANALKPVVLPGETLSVKVIRPGEEAGQGVGYLEDGTMIVAEQARDYIGREITIMVTSVLQTSAGRMIFGRLDGDKTNGRRDRKGSEPAVRSST